MWLLNEVHMGLVTGNTEIEDMTLPNICEKLRGVLESQDMEPQIYDLYLAVIEIGYRLYGSAICAKDIY
jgi:hypothetical protein